MSLVERMDPRVAAFVAAMPPAATAGVTNREELLAEAASEVGRARARGGGRPHGDG